MVHACVIVYIAIAAVAISNTGQVTAGVRHFQSPLVTTGRRHACPEEPLSFKCEVHGRFLCWTFDSVYQATFFFDSPVNHAETVTERFNVQAILTGNHALSGNNIDTTYRRLISMLILDSFHALVENQRPHNISCSSDATQQAVVTQIALAETPNMPRNVTATPQQSTQSQATTISNDTVLITWKEPSNMDNFDLECYRISILITELRTGSKYYMYGTSIEPEYHIHVPYQSIANISVHAVSECSQQVGLQSNSVLVWNHGAHTINLQQVSQVDAKTVTVGTKDFYSSGFKESKGWNIGLVLLFGVLTLFLTWWYPSL